MTQPQSRACSGCQGACGRTETEQRDGKVIQVWRTCQGCHGTGVQGGGV